MGFQQGLSGLGASAKNLDVIGNNIANVSTVGYKASRTEFADVYANSLYGSGGIQVGIGTQVVNVAQQFTQGNISITNNPLDIAINGDGFFRLSDNGAPVYSRNGQFHLDAEGYIVNNAGLPLVGYAVDANGQPIATEVPLQISVGYVNPKATETLDMAVNLDSREPTPTAGFSPIDTDSYNHATTATVYDERGNAHALNFYFVKTSDTTWDVYGTLINSVGTSTRLDGNTTMTTPPAYTAADGLLGTMTFDSGGNLTGSTVAGITIDASALGTGAGDVNVTPSLTGTTLFGNEFGVNSIAQDGYSSGQFTSLAVDDTGAVYGRYTNGLTQTLGQVVLYTFANPSGLQSMGNNLWTAPANETGPAVANLPGQGTAGAVQAGAVEDANVDLTGELVNLIVAQRLYQANAQTIRAQDQILQTLVNLR